MVAVAASVAFAAEASVTVKTKIDGLVNRAEDTGDVSIFAPSHGGDDTNIDFVYADERVGAELKLRATEVFGDGGGFDAVSVWFKPVDLFKVTVGTGIGASLNGGGWNSILEAENTKGAQVDVNVDALTFTTGAGTSDWGTYFANATNQEADHGSAWAKVAYAIDGVGTVSVLGGYNVKNNWNNDKTVYGKTSMAKFYHIGFGADFTGNIADAGLTYFLAAAGFVGDKYGSGEIARKDELGFNAVAFAADAKYSANGLTAELYVPGQINLYEDVDDDDKVLVGTAVKLSYDLGGVAPYLEVRSPNWLAKDDHLRVTVIPGIGGTFAGKLGWDINFEATIVPDQADGKETFFFNVPVSFSVSF